VYDPACIRELLDHLTPERVRLYWASKTFASESAASENGTCAKPSEAKPSEAKRAPKAVAVAAVSEVSAAAAVRDESGDEAMFGLVPWESEPIYSTRYCFEKLPAAWMAAWTDDAQVGRVAWFVLQVA
jgi:hypothetical protein